MSMSHERLIGLAQSALWALCIKSDNKPTAACLRVAASAVALSDRFEHEDAVYVQAVKDAVEIVTNDLDLLQIRKNARIIDGAYKRKTS